MNQFFNNFPGLEGVFKQTSYEDMRSLIFLHYLVGRIKPKLVLELGTGLGCSTAFMALAMGEGKIITIDNYQGVGTKYPHKAAQNLESCGVRDKIIQVQDSSFHAGNIVKQWLGENAAPEIVFMDACHADVDLRREYDALQDILPREHIIVVDDALPNEVPSFIAWVMGETDRYAACVILPYHMGLAVLVTNDGLLSHVSHTTAEVNKCQL